MSDAGEFLDSSMMMMGDGSECFGSLNMLSKRKRSINTRRFSDEQIKSLETTFESESKLEPRKKMQLARELGLQPRQVAIWFQNKRARWKSKQLERDYNILMANYSTLASQFETLKKEKQSLLAQLQKLNDQVEKSKERSQCCGENEDVARNSKDRKLDNGENFKNEFELKPNLSLDGSEHGIGVLSDDDSSINRAEYLGLEEEADILNMVEPADGSLTSPENWGGLDSGGLLGQSTSSDQWWNFWS